MKFQFIDDRRHEYAVKTMCCVLEASECGYYAWRKRPKSEREQQNEELTQHIQQVYTENRQIYGSPRIHGELRVKASEMFTQESGSPHEKSWNQCWVQTASGADH